LQSDVNIIDASGYARNDQWQILLAESRQADRETLLRRLATVEVETEIRKAASAAILKAFQETADSTSA